MYPTVLKITRIRNPIRMFLGPGSASVSQRYGFGFGSGFFPFLLKVLSGMK